jgi:hypothetical protein
MKHAKLKAESIRALGDAYIAGESAREVLERIKENAWSSGRKWFALDVMHIVDFFFRNEHVELLMHLLGAPSRESEPNSVPVQTDGGLDLIRLLSCWFLCLDFQGRGLSEEELRSRRASRFLREVGRLQSFAAKHCADGRHRELIEIEEHFQLERDGARRAAGIRAREDGEKPLREALELEAPREPSRRFRLHVVRREAVEVEANSLEDALRRYAPPYRKGTKVLEVVAPKRYDEDGRPILEFEDSSG